MTEQHQARLPECTERFRQIDKDQGLFRKSVERKLDDLNNNVIGLKKALLDGNGRKGLIWLQDDRIQALEDQHKAKDPAPSSLKPRTIKEALLAIPWFGWCLILVCANTLNPQTWAILREIAQKLAGN
ncbi:hypothetical protein N9X87_00105 [bacterium]|nr:hypothetical protein [bacterium]